jgi:hypothetical protein
MKPEEVKKLIEDSGGKVTGMGGPLPDGSGFAVASFPLPKDHWIYDTRDDAPPMSFRRGTDDPARSEMVEKIRAIGRYAIRASTMKGREMDFDPDAMLQNLVVAALGYWTPSGLSNDPNENP